MTEAWLVNCEESGRVAAAIRAIGVEAWSCDLIETEGDPAFHIVGDAIAAAYSRPWAGMIAHPPCTYLANSGAKHLYAGMKMENGPNPERWAKMGEAAGFFNALRNAPIEKIAVENPIMIGHAKRLFGIPEQDQTIQPWMFGHMEQKATCLWLKNLPPLRPTNDVREATMALPRSQRDRVHFMPPGPNRQKERSRTLPGVAAAMAEQWARTA